MRFRAVLPALAACVGAVLPTSATAQCAGFTDVPNDTSCGGVTWIKNRGVTVGCTSTLYCPGQPVSRLAMALFMHRLGNVLTPAAHGMEGTGTALSLDTPTDICQTATAAATNYNRQLSGQAHFSFVAPASGSLTIRITTSTNGGPFNQLGFPVQLTFTAGERVHGSGVAPPSTLPSGQTHRFAIRIENWLSPPGTSLTGWTCNLQLNVNNLNSGF